VDDLGRPFAVEVVAGDHDDVAMAEVEDRRKDPAVPERHHRVVTRREDPGEMLFAFDAPPPGAAERAEGGIAQSTDDGSLPALGT
jgi:hypothetical protein